MYKKLSRVREVFRTQGFARFTVFSFCPENVQNLGRRLPVY